MNLQGSAEPTSEAKGLRLRYDLTKSSRRRPATRGIAEWLYLIHQEWWSLDKHSKRFLTAMNRTKVIAQLVQAFRLQWIADGLPGTTSATLEYKQELTDKSDSQLLREVELVDAL